MCLIVIYIYIIANIGLVALQNGRDGKQCERQEYQAQVGDLEPSFPSLHRGSFRLDEREVMVPCWNFLDCLGVGSWCQVNKGFVLWLPKYDLGTLFQAVKSRCEFTARGNLGYTSKLIYSFDKLLQRVE